MSTSVDRVVEELSKVLEDLHKTRLAALSETRDVQVMMRTFLQREEKRLMSRLGERHPRVQQLNAQLKINLQLVNRLAVEHEVYRVEVPQVAEEAALVHGRVVDENLRGIAGLLVCLVDERGTPIKDVEGSTTDTTGYYAITLDSELTDRACETHVAGVFLAVLSRTGRLLHRHPKPLALSKGARLVVGVGLNRSDLSGVGEAGRAD